MESTDARRAFPCWDEPELKATFEVTLVVDDGLAAYSNGPVVEETARGRTGKRRVRFAPTMVMSTYLVAFVVGPLEATEPVDVDGVPLRIVHPPGKGHLTAFALDVGAHALRFFTDYFGIPYPGDKLDLVAIPDFAFGAMENLGCVTFRESALLVDPATASRVELERVADVVCHEIAHMWFGDLVTMKWWNGIWLNEAFATFMEVLAVDAFRPEWQRWVSFGVEREAAMAVDGLHATRPVEFPVGRPEEAQGMFDVLTYQKGGSVLRMLEQFIGPDVFREGIHDYLVTHAYANTETRDLWDALERSSGRPVAHDHGHLDQPGRLPAGAGGRGRAAHPAARSPTRGEPGRRHRLALAGAGAHRDPRRPAPTRRVRPADRRPAAPSTAGGDGELLVNAGGSGYYRVAYPHRAVVRAWPAGSATSPRSSATTWCRTPGRPPLAGQAPAGRPAPPGPRPWATRARVTRACGRWSSAPSACSTGSSPTATGRPWPPAVRTLLGPLADATGLGPARRPTTSAPRRCGPAVLRTLGTIGDDPDGPGRGGPAVRRRGTATLHADTESAILDIVAARRGADEYEALPGPLPRHRPTRRRRTATSTHWPRSAEPTWPPRTFDLAMTEVRTPERALRHPAAAWQPAAGPATWARITAAWDELLAKFPSNILPRMLDGVRGLCTPPELADEVTAFVEAHPLAAGGRTVEQILERLAVSVAFGRREGAGLAATARRRARAALTGRRRARGRPAGAPAVPNLKPVQPASSSPSSRSSSWRSCPTRR